MFRLFAAAVFVAAAAAEQYVPHNKIAAIAAVSFAAAAAVVFSAAAKQQKYDKNIVTSAHRLFSSPLILSLLPPSRLDRPYRGGCLRFVFCRSFVSYGRT